MRPVKDALVFRRAMERFVDSSNSEAEGQLWPLVRMVRMRSNSWTALRTGEGVRSAVSGFGEEGG